MSLSLPPKGAIRQTPEVIEQIRVELTSVIQGHPGAVNTYTFYEEIDRWLGPWGTQGYPIGYGKFYNIAFSTNAKLLADAVAKKWVWRTGIKLQELLRDFIVDWMKTRPLLALDEPTLRKGAFDSHPQAYDEGGLATLMLVAPELIPLVAAIPAVEFLPTSDNFGATLEQVVVTSGRVVPKGIGAILAGLAGPAHTGLFRNAARQDRQRLMAEIQTNRHLAELRRSIESGRVDHIAWLDELIARLNATEFSDQGMARAAREVIGAAQRRRGQVLNGTLIMLKESPEVRKRVETKFPRILKPSEVDGR